MGGGPTGMERIHQLKCMKNTGENPEVRIFSATQCSLRSPSPHPSVGTLELLLEFKRKNKIKKS